MTARVCVCVCVAFLCPVASLKQLYNVIVVGGDRAS